MSDLVGEVRAAYQMYLADGRNSRFPTKTYVPLLLNEIERLREENDILRSTLRLIERVLPSGR